MEKFLVILLSILIPMHYLGRGLFYIDLVLVVVVFVYLIYKNRINIIKLIDKFIIVAFSFYLVALIINLFNPTFDYEPNIKLLYSIPILLVILNYTFIYSKHSESNFILFQKVLFYLTSIICAVVFFSYLINFNIIYSLKEMSLINNFDHWMFHSKQNIFAILIGIFLYFYFNNRNFINLVALVFIYLGTFASHGRTAILTIIIGTIIYMIIEYIVNKKPKIKTFFPIISLVVMSILIFIVISGETINDLNRLTSNRFDGWLLNIEFILRENSFLGYGIQGSLQLYDDNLLAFKHPHNIYIETLFSIGVIGFIIICSLTIVYLINLIKSKELYNKNIAITTFFAVFINVQAIGGIWGYASTLITLSVLYLSSKRIRKI